MHPRPLGCDATPLDWARHFHQLSIAVLLEPVTTKAGAA
jgi:hypothetical protein